MKNSTKIIGALAVILSITFACKKDNEGTKLEEQKFSAPIQMATMNGKSENAIVVGTSTALEAAFSGKQDRVLLKKSAQKNNLFIPVTGTVDPVGPVDPVNPTDLCWDEINAYYNAHIEGWLATANQNCTPVTVCITCPNAAVGIYVMYVIKPTSFRCNIAEASAAELFNFSKFNFSDLDYESAAVSEFISGKK